jgi:hypothetical protein
MRWLQGNNKAAKASQEGENGRSDYCVATLNTNDLCFVTDWTSLIAGLRSSCQSRLGPIRMEIVPVAFIFSPRFTFCHTILFLPRSSNTGAYNNCVH